MFIYIFLLFIITVPRVCNAEKLVQPQQQDNPLVNMLGAGAAALAASKSDSALAQWGRAIHNSNEYIKKGEQENLRKSWMGHQLMGNIATQLANDDYRNKALASNQDYRNKALALQERALQLKAMAPKKRKYSGQDMKIIKELELLKDKGKELLDTANKFEKIQPELDTGGISGAIANAATSFGRMGIPIASFLIGKKEFVQLFTTLSNIISGLAHDLGILPGYSDWFSSTLHIIKPNLANEPSVNKAHYNEMKRLAHDMIEHADDGLVRMDIEPKAIEDRAWGDPKTSHLQADSEQYEKKSHTTPSQRIPKEVLLAEAKRRGW